MADDNNKTNIPEGISNLSDEEAITEIDIGSFLKNKDESAKPAIGDEIEKTEQSIEDEIQSLMDSIMNSGPVTPAPQEKQEEQGEKPLGDLWMNPEEYIDIPEAPSSKEPEVPNAPVPEVAKDDIMSMIEELKADTDNEKGFESLITDIESNENMAPIDIDSDSAPAKADEAPAAPPAPKAEKKTGEIDIHAEGFEDELAALLGDEPAEKEEPASESQSEDTFGDSFEVEEIPEDKADEGAISFDKNKSSSVPVQAPEGAVEIAAASVSSEPQVQVFDLLQNSEKTVGNVPVEIIEDDGKISKQERKQAKIDKKIAEGKNPKVAEIIRKTVLAISIIVIIISSAYLAKTYIYEPMMFKKHQSEIQNIVSEPVNDVSETIAQNDSKYPVGMLAKYKKLYDINKDLRGWVSIPGLEINLPIAQAKDNDFYLHRNIYQKRTQYGVPFFDYRIEDFKNLPKNTVVYGHNMHYDDLIFGKLENYRDIRGFKEAPTIECNTIYGDYTWLVYAAFITNSTASQDNGYMFTYNWIDLSDSKFMEFINEVDKRKMFTSPVDIQPSDKILTLSTCCYDFDGARLVVIARLKRDGESVSIDTSQAYNNDNPKYPQAWYNANKKNNPYADDARWYPNK
ncbi:MAG: class B sortase [Clostridia bacterium]|nr:class B sortase [Clostridia bacterium]